MVVWGTQNIQFLLLLMRRTAIACLFIITLVTLVRANDNYVKYLISPVDHIVFDSLFGIYFLNIIFRNKKKTQQFTKSKHNNKSCNTTSFVIKGKRRCNVKTLLLMYSKTNLDLFWLINYKKMLKTNKWKS